MPLVLAFAAVLAGQAAPEAPVQPAAQPQFADAPDWLRLPTQAQKLAVYPRTALSKRISGQASIGCTLDVDGYLRACRVLQETPEGMGFGQAALSLASAFRMTPLTPRGASVDGSQVTIPIGFAPAQTRTSFRLR